MRLCHLQHAIKNQIAINSLTWKKNVNTVGWRAITRRLTICIWINSGIGN